MSRDLFKFKRVDLETMHSECSTARIISIDVAMLLKFRQLQWCVCEDVVPQVHSGSYTRHSTEKGNLYP